MGATMNFDIELQRNADYAREFAITDDAGEALDLTGATFEWSFKLRAGDADPPIASAAVNVTDADGGLVEVGFSGSDFSAIDGEFEPVRIAFDWIGTQDSLTTVLARGNLILMPGVS